MQFTVSVGEADGRWIDDGEMFLCTDGDGPGAQDGAAAHGAGQSDENEEVMRALLIHEKRSGAGGGAAAANAASAAKGLAANASDSDSDTSESDDEPPANTASLQHRVEQQQLQQEEEEDDDDFEEVTDEPMVMVGGRPCSYREVSQRPELVEQMSAQEKEAYIEMGQTLYQDMYY